MAAHIALLRAVNLGGKTMVAMAELRAMAEALGFAGVRTLLQSGNLVFETRGRQSTDAIEKTLAAEAEKRFGRPIDFFVRDAKEWVHVIAENPFPAEAMVMTGTPRCWSRTHWASATAPRSSAATSISKCGPARCCACWGRTARARRPCSRPCSV